MSIYKIKVKEASGKEISLNKYKNQVILVVNTASKCGFTSQFQGLEALYQKYKDQGFVVLGFPCNQFKEQDPAQINEIVSFCQLNFGVTFPMMGKIDVNGENQSPLFAYLKEKQGGLFKSDIKWNFTKFLINQQGEVVARFGSTTTPAKIDNHIATLLEGNGKTQKGTS